MPPVVSLVIAPSFTHRQGGQNAFRRLTTDAHPAEAPKRDSSRTGLHKGLRRCLPRRNLRRMRRDYCDESVSDGVHWRALSENASVSRAVLLHLGLRATNGGRAEVS